MADILKFRPPPKPANRFMVNGVFAVGKTSDDEAVSLVLASSRMEMSPELALKLAAELAWWAEAVEWGQGDLLDGLADEDDKPA